MHINFKNKNNTQKGFTLLEMLTVLGIVAVISSVVMFNHGKFTSQTMLTNMAYEVALSIREAQIYGVSVRNTGDTTPNFDVPYGINIPAIPAAGLSNYHLFKDVDTPENQKFDGSCPGGTECVTTYTLQKGITIYEVRTKANSPTCINRTKPLNIAFDRPDPEALFSLDDNTNLSTVTQVQITLKSKDNSYRYVVVSKNGQISVQNDPICS